MAVDKAAVQSAVLKAMGALSEPLADTIQVGMEHGVGIAATALQRTIASARADGLDAADTLHVVEALLADMPLLLATLDLGGS